VRTHREVLALQKTVVTFSERHYVVGHTPIGARRFPCPCDLCPLRRECRQHWLACLAFDRFVNNTQGRPRKSVGVRKPTRTMFRQLFPDAIVPSSSLRA